MEKIAENGSSMHRIPNQNPLSKSFCKVLFGDFKLYIFLKKRAYNSVIVSVLKFNVIDM